MYGEFLKCYLTGKTFRPHYPTKANAPGNGARVILVHGVMHRSVVFFPMAEFLAAHGYDVRVYDYMTTRATIPELGREFRDYLVETVRSDPGREIRLVVHSMGGLLTRWAFGETPRPPELNAIHRVLMLGTPNLGSEDADFYRTYFPGLNKVVKSLDGLSAHIVDWSALPKPDGLEIVTVCGDRDTRVDDASSHYPGEKAHLHLPLTHCQMLYDRRSFELVLDYLSK